MSKPNIIVILADDMGYGDVRHCNPECKFPTPHLDRLGQEGISFSDAHTSSAVCTPSRYSLLTGRYCWRGYLRRGVIRGTSEHLMEPGRHTMADLARAAGYATACVGKWHLGWDWAQKPGCERSDDVGMNDDTGAWIDFSKPIANGPTAYGFDHFYGISGSLDMPPYVYVNDDMPVEEPTAWGTKGEFMREGPRMASLRANNVLSHITDHLIDWIEAQDRSQPFLAYFPITAPHTPISPAPEFDGVSGINPYADFCMEVDHRIGQVMACLDRLGIADDTLVVFTADNGASAKPSDCAALEEHFGHFCSERSRGYKSDIWDGGHRVPFLLRWPQGIAAGSHNDQPVGLFDLFATVAEVTDVAIPDGRGEDSVSLVPALRGQALDESQRLGLVHHSIDGRFAIRHGQWKLCRCPGSGGWTLRDAQAVEDGLPPIQLYDMSADPGERTNLCDQHPEVVEDLTKRLHRLVSTGCSVPARGGANHHPIDEEWWQVDWLQEIPEAYLVDD